MPMKNVWISVKCTFISDEKGKEVMWKLTGCTNVAEFQKLERNHRNLCIQKLKGAGLSVRQISRLTGVSKSVVGRL